MHRFFIKPEQICNNQVFFLPEEIRQIRNVLRLIAGNRITVLDNTGKSYTVEITKSLNKTLIGNIIEMQSQKADSIFKISLGQSFAKGSKIDFIIQKATEIGVSNITLMETERSIIKHKIIEQNNRLSRWKKIAREAAEQSCRLTIPDISCAKSLKDFCSSDSADLKLIFWEKEKEKKLRDCFKNDISIRNLSIIVGPEGGFSQKEIDLAVKFGFIPIWLGHRILKTETAVISILSIIQYIKGELG